MKTTYTVPVRLSEDLLRRLLYLCEAEGRSPSAQVQLMLRNSVQYFERAKGHMDPAKLRQYDLSAFRDADPDEGGRGE